MKHEATWSPALADFEEAQLAAYSPHTARTRLYSVRRFAEWSETPPWFITRAQVDGYLTYGRDVRGWRQSNVYAVRVALIAFYRWAVEDGHTDTNPLTDEVLAPAEIDPWEEWGQALDEYTDYELIAGRRPGTRRLHRTTLLAFARHARTGPWQVTPTMLTEYMSHGIERRHWKPESARSVRSTLKGFYKWARLTEHVNTDPTRFLPVIHASTPAPRPCPDDVITHALEQADPTTRLMILFGAYCGLRRSEIATVSASNWDGEVLTVTGKGGKTRTVPVVLPELRHALNSTSSWLFPSPVRPTRPISPDSVDKYVCTYLPRPWTCHTLRHRFATAAYAGVHDVLAVGQVLGHARPETTKRYIRVPTRELQAVALAAATGAAL